MNITQYLTDLAYRDRSQGFEQQLESMERRTSGKLFYCFSFWMIFYAQYPEQCVINPDFYATQDIAKIWEEKNTGGQQ